MPSAPCKTGVDKGASGSWLTPTSFLSYKERDRGQESALFDRPESVSSTRAPSGLFSYCRFGASRLALSRSPFGRFAPSLAHSFLYFWSIRLDASLNEPRSRTGRPERIVSSQPCDFTAPAISRHASAAEMVLAASAAMIRGSPTLRCMR